MFCLSKFFRHVATGLAATCFFVLSTPANAQTITHVPLYTFRADEVDSSFGESVSSAGDVNNDGYTDLIVGVRLDGSNSGSARIFSGKDGSTLFTFEPRRGFFFGESVSGAGDVNNDGFDDVIIGAPGDNTNGNNSGSAFVLSGRNGLRLYTFDGDSPEESFGGSVSGAGDVNNDGFPDLIVGAGRDDNNGVDSGSARVFSGQDGSILYTFEGDSPKERFGGSVSGAGDVNNDGYADLIVGAIFDDNSRVDSGSARVFSGQDGSVLYTFEGDASTDGGLDEFGGSVSGAGDVNNDGYADLIVGASRDDDNGFDSGIARVFSGRDGSILFTFEGDSQNDRFGTSVSRAGDVNNDGHADLIVGAPTGFGSPANGSVRVLSGQDGTTIYTSDADGPLDVFGLSVSGAGDVNSDGLDDFIVGAPGGDYARVFVSQVSRRTLLVDFGGDRPPGNGNASADVRTLGTNADFRANDLNISSQASVVNFDFPAGDQVITSNAGLEVSVDIDMVDPNDPSIRFDPLPFNPNNGLFADNVPILDGYYFSDGSLNLEATISGMEEIAPGDQITLTVYGIGGGPLQDGSIEAFYNNSSLGVQFTEASGPIESTFAQFSFNKIPGVNELRFVNSGASESPFATFNGFSISTAPAITGLAIIADQNSPLTISSGNAVWNTVQFPPSPFANVYWDANSDGIFGNSFGENTGNTSDSLRFIINPIVSGTSLIFGLEGFQGAGTTGSVSFTITNSDSSTQQVTVDEGTATSFTDSNGDTLFVEFEFNEAFYGDVVFNGGVGGGGGGPTADHQGVLTFSDSLFILGDVNGDGVVNFLDIAPFIALLSSQEFQAEADIDGNGIVNFLDIGPFIVILSGQ